MKFILFIVIMIIFNILLWFFVVSRYLNKRVERFERELMERHYTEVDSMYRKMRGWRHDYHNHIQAMKACLDQQEYPEMADYLNQVDTSLKNVDQVIKTGNLMIDAILNSKIALISENKIGLDVTVSVPAEMGIRAIDLCVLLGNLLDNAMEACLRIDREKERFIRIYIDVIKGQLYLCITNSMNGKARRKGLIFPSTKSGAHGFGLERIDRIVSQYKGYVNRQTENGVFATEVMLPLS